MRFKYLLWTLVMTVALCATGCEFSVGGGIDDDDDNDSGGGIAAGFSWSWTLVEYETNAAIDCNTGGAEYARIQITDSEGASHDIWWLCSDSSGETDTWQIATGEGTVTASLLTIDEVTVSQTDPWTFNFESGELRNELNPVEFAVDFWDPETEATASLTWEWKKATADNPEGEPFTADDCSTLGIDYVNIWVWDPVAEQWWANADITEFPCPAADQPTDDDIWGDEIYSGLHINDFLVAGTYELFLGFYTATGYTEGDDTTDLLVYQDSAGSGGDDLDGVLAADEDLEDGTTLYITVFDQEEEETVFGVLKIELLWGQSGGSVYDTCADSNVKEMGFLLRSDGWVAAEVELGNGLECLDWLNFEEVPVLENAYELLVSGLSKEDDFLWYHLCSGLEPEIDVTLEEATGYECKVTNTLEGN